MVKTRWIAEKQRLLADKLRKAKELYPGNFGELPVDGDGLPITSANFHRWHASARFR